MQIKIVDEKGRRICIPLPALLLNRTSAGLILHFLRKSGKPVPLTARDFHKLFRCLRQCRKDFPKLVLVEVSGKDGGEIRITL